MQEEGLPALDEGCALFLDFDGTLADLAPRPDAVVVEPGLVEVLAGLSARMRGALAVVSGRPIEQLDQFLAPLQLPCAGVHGAERRGADMMLVRQEPAAQAPLERLAALAEALAAQHPGLLVERKPGALALHYRLAPALEAACLALMEEAVAREPTLALLHGKQVIEAKPLGANKGAAVLAFMREPPFARRAPLFIGDDATDEAGFEAVQQLGGRGVKVGAGATLAKLRIASPAALRAWLRQAASAAMSASSK